MSEKFANADPALEEQLVAYLDGELDAEASRRIEELVATDAEVRRKLQRWDRTWQLLDELNTSSVAEEFTQTTLEMVTVAAEEDAQQGRSEAARCRRRRWAITGVSLLAAGLAGFVIVMLLTPDPNRQFNRQLLHDLPVLAYLDQYRQIDDVEFPRVLHRERLFAQGDDVGLLDGSVLGEAVRAEASMAARRQRVQGMNPAEKHQLQQLQQRFAKLKPEKQERLRELHRQIEADPNAADLRQVMHRYTEWLKTLPAYTRAELVELEPAKRVERIKKLLEAESEKPNRKDTEGLFRWLGQYAAKHETGIVKSLPEPLQQRLDTMDPGSRRRAVAWILRERWLRPGPGKLPLLSEDELADLRSSLSEETRKRLKRKTPADQRRIIGGWAPQIARHRHSARRFKGGPLPPDLQDQLPPDLQEQLDDFFEKLTPEQRDPLLSLPGDEMLRELWRMYVARFRSPDLPIRPPHHLRRGKKPGGPGPPRGRPGRPPEGPRPEFRPAVPRRETRPHDR